MLSVSLKKFLGLLTVLLKRLVGYRIIRCGELVPWWLGGCWFSPLDHGYVCMFLPFSLVCRFGRWVWFWVKEPQNSKLDQLIELAYSEGRKNALTNLKKLTQESYQKGYDDCLETIKRLRGDRSVT